MLVSFATATPKSVPSPTAPKIGVKIARIGPTPAIATKIPTPAAHKRNEHNKKHKQPQQQSTGSTTQPQSSTTQQHQQSPFGTFMGPFSFSPQQGGSSNATPDIGSVIDLFFF